MKKILAAAAVITGLLAAVFFGTRSTYAAGDVPINIVNFPNPAFREYVLENFDLDEDSRLSEYEISLILRVSLDSSLISNLAGIEYFTSLEELDLANSKVSSIYLDQNTALIKLVCNNNDSLTGLDLRKNKLLSDLECQENDKLTSVNLSGNTGIERINCHNNPKQTTLKVSGCTALKDLHCDNCSITALYLQDSTMLENLFCFKNQISSLDLTNNKKLKYVSCNENVITSLNVTGLTNLLNLVCSSNVLKSLDLTSNTKLEILNCDKNSIASLDVSKNTALRELDCGWNKLTALNLEENTSLVFLGCSYNQLTSLNLKNHTLLNRLVCAGNQLTSLDLKKNTKLNFLQCEENQISTLNLRSCPAMLNWLETGTRTEENGVVYYVCRPFEESEYFVTLSYDSSVNLIALNAPTVEAINNSSARVLWNWYRNQQSAEIYRKTKDGSYQKVGTVSGNLNAFSDKKAKKGETYKYRVRVKTDIASSEYGYSEWYLYNPFTDIAEWDSYFNAVMWAVRNGIISGTDELHFSPHNSCTRYQFAVMLYKLAGRPDAGSVSLPFKDVKTTASYYKAVSWAYQNSIISGTTKTTFSPNEPIKRYQAVQMLYKYAGKPAVGNVTNPFVDVSKKSSYYNAVMWAVKNKITNGTNATHFSPNAECERYQMVVFLYKFSNLK